MITFQDYLNEINKTTRHPIFKLVFLRNDETPLSEIVDDLNNDGSLNIKQNNGVRRSLSITLDNFNKEYFPQLDSVIWLGKKVKLFLGLKINDEDYFLPQGVFVMDDPTVDSNRNTVSLNVSDKFTMLNGELGGEMDRVFIINAGITLNTAVRSVMALSNDTAEIIIDSNVASLTLPYQIIKETGQTIGDVLLELAFAFTCDVYYNENGSLVFEKVQLDNEKGSTHNFTVDDEETNYSGGSIKYDFRKVYNSCLVIGDNVNGLIATAKTFNNDLLSDTSIPNIGYERVLVVSDDIIYNSGLALERAKYELKRATVVGTDIPISSTPMYHLNVGSVAKLTDDRLNLIGKRSVIDSITIPLNNNQMNINLLDSFEVTLT